MEVTAYFALRDFGRRGEAPREKALRARGAEWQVSQIGQAARLPRIRTRGASNPYTGRCNRYIQSRRIFQGLPRLETVPSVLESREKKTVLFGLNWHGLFLSKFPIQSISTLTHFGIIPIFNVTILKSVISSHAKNKNLFEHPFSSIVILKKKCL